VPRRRESKQDAVVADAKPNVLALSGPVETAAEESPSVSSARAAAELPPTDRSDPVPVEPPTIASCRRADDIPANVVADVVADDDLTPSDLPDIAVLPSPDAANLQLRVESKPRKQLGRGRKPELVDTTQVPSDRTIPSDDTLSLDDEIRLLRG
ncbi:hypothetical protein ASF70_01665, partial [Rhizobium sp. Leaf321]|uniref:hypothetical protein n=1 Tax=Rhizobium sp. Leaf321 TaxID=1736335 RepID=UPI0007155DEB